MCESVCFKTVYGIVTQKSVTYSVFEKKPLFFKSISDFTKKKIIIQSFNVFGGFFREILSLKSIVMEY